MKTSKIFFIFLVTFIPGIVLFCIGSVNGIIVQMFVIRKLRPVETISGIGGGRIEESDGGGEFNYDIFNIL
jgi:hypothetical protein